MVPDFVKSTSPHWPLTQNSRSPAPKNSMRRRAEPQ